MTGHTMQRLSGKMRRTEKKQGLVVSRKEHAFQNKEKEKRAAELLIANKKNAAENKAYSKPRVRAKSQRDS